MSAGFDTYMFNVRPLCDVAFGLPSALAPNSREIAASRSRHASHIQHENSITDRYPLLRGMRFYNVLLGGHPYEE
jgi:hypothetical protein